MTGSRCWPEPTGWRRHGSGRWRPPWSGATSCSVSRSGGYSGRCRCSRGRSRWRPPRRWPGRTRQPQCCGWWTAHCWSRRGPGRTAGPGIRCWRRCAPTVPGCWPRPVSRTRRPRRWPGGRWRRRSRPPRACRPGPGKPTPRAGSTPRTPPCARCSPGRWAATGRRRCGWPARWTRGGSCGAGCRACTRCWPSWPGTPSRAATGGAASSSGPAGQRGPRPMRPGRWRCSPRCGTRWRAGCRPGRWPTPWPAGRWHWGCWARTPRRSRMPAVPWPSPASWAIRSARYAPCCTSPSPPRPSTT